MGGLSLIPLVIPKLIPMNMSGFGEHLGLRREEESR